MEKSFNPPIVEGSNDTFYRDANGCFYVRGKHGELLRANRENNSVIPRIRLKKKDRLALRKLLNERKAEIDAVVKGN